MRKKYIVFLFLLLLVFSTFVYFLNIVTNIDYDNIDYKFCIEREESTSVLRELQLDNLITTINFPYDEFLQNINYCDLKVVKQSLSELEKITGNSFLTQEILSIAYTKELRKKLPENLDLNSIAFLISWVDNLNVCSKLDETCELFYIAVYSDWYAIFNEELLKIYQNNKSIKYNFKFRYLSQKCAEAKMPLNITPSKFEKIIYNFIDSNWSYLFNRFWGGTSLVFKFFLVFILIVFSTILFLGIIKLKELLWKNDIKTN
jgi:hypothetical protein